MIRCIIGQIHLWSGLALCAPFVILGLTGSVLVFEDELNEAFGPAASHIAAGARHGRRARLSPRLMPSPPPALCR